jgi:hypothetical protein
MTSMQLRGVRNVSRSSSRDVHFQQERLGRPGLVSRKQMFGDGLVVLAEVGRQAPTMAREKKPRPGSWDPGRGGGSETENPNRRLPDI